MAETWDLSDLLEDAEDQNKGPTKVSKDDPQSLRKFATSVARENAELKKQLAEQSAKSRKDNITDKVKAKSLPDKVAKLVPADVDLDKLDAWLDEYKDVFLPPTPQGPGEAGETEEVDEQEAEERAAQDRMSTATGATVPANRPTDLLAQVRDPNLSRDQLMKMIEGAGGGYGVG